MDPAWQKLPVRSGGHIAGTKPKSKCKSPVFTISSTTHIYLLSYRGSETTANSMSVETYTETVRKIAKWINGQSDRSELNLACLLQMQATVGTSCS